ncbi:9361_t:CDS:1, partial [Racocetra persica]
ESTDPDPVYDLLWYSAFQVFEFRKSFEFKIAPEYCKHHS